MRDGKGTVDLVDADRQRRRRPTTRALGPTRKCGRVALQGAAATLGHGPALAAGAVEGDVERAVVLRVAGAAPAGQA